MVQLHHSPGPASSVASGKSETPNRQLRTGHQFALADGARYSPTQLGPGDAADAQQLAVCARTVRLSLRAGLGTEGSDAAKATVGESLVLVSVQEGYRLWSRSYDGDLNPVVALARRVGRGRLGPLSGRCFLDVATGTGYWLNYARSRGARAYGVDLSPEMLLEAASKPSLKERLICADMSVLPLKNEAADIAVCSLALGYVPSVRDLFRELARVAKRASGRVIVSDLHELAIQAGWRWCFKVQGREYQIEQFHHTASTTRS
jgi:2-polyprenyl-3-methyl-5-hydroxy-6-metoxy-1,4-benzoquinol methylase